MEKDLKSFKEVYAGEPLFWALKEGQKKTGAQHDQNKQQTEREQDQAQDDSNKNKK